MPNYLHRTTKEYLTSVSPISLAEPEANYIQDPDMSPIAGFGSVYWIITGDLVSLMSLAEREAVDAAALIAARDAVANGIDALESYGRAFALVIMDEINILRGQHGLADRTPAQLKSALRNKLDT